MEKEQKEIGKIYEKENKNKELEIIKKRTNRNSGT